MALTLPFRLLRTAVHAEIPRIDGPAGRAGPGSRYLRPRRAAVAAEIPRVPGLAAFRAGPGSGSLRFRLSAGRAEVPRIASLTARTGPAAQCLGRLRRPWRRRLSCLAGCQFLSQAGTSLIGHIHAHIAHGCAHTAFIGSGSAHGIGRRVDQGPQADIRSGHSQAHLGFLDLFFVFFIGLDAVDTDGYDFDSP